MFAAETQHIAALTVKTLKDMRTEEAFGLFFEQEELLHNFRHRGPFTSKVEEGTKGP